MNIIEQDDNFELAQKDYIIAYYNHQNTRMAQLEYQGITITSIVLISNFIVLIFGLKQQVNHDFSSNKIMILCLVIINIFAVLFVERINSWEKTHRMRAKKILETYAPFLYNINSSIFAPHKVRFYEHEHLQIFLHAFWIFLSIVLYFF